MGDASVYADLENKNIIIVGIAQGSHLIDNGVLITSHPEDINQNIETIDEYLNAEKSRLAKSERIVKETSK